MSAVKESPEMSKMICLKIPKAWSENFKEEMLSVDDAWDDVMTGFQEMEAAVDWMRKSMQALLKVFSEYEWLEIHARSDGMDG